jgi:hypothetical protein
VIEARDNDRTRSDSLLVPRVATFFSLYPETLGLADGTTFCIGQEVPLRGFAKTAMHLAEGQLPFWLDSALSGVLAVSIRFHRGKRDRNIIEELDEKLMSVVRPVTGESFPDFDRIQPDVVSASPERSPEYDSSGIAYAVIEMTTQVAIPRKEYFEACEPSQDVMGPTLTRCIDGLIKIVDAYRFTQEVFIPGAARERLGPWIVAATRAADPDQGGWDHPAVHVLNTFATPGAGHFISGTQTPETLGEMGNQLRLEYLGHPSVAIGHMQKALDSSLFYDGNFRAVLMFAHSSSEIMMDLALMAMLFEEGKSAAEAASRFATPLKTRILTEYHNRLGGSWSPKGSGAVAAWIRDVLVIRHRVAHAGYLPLYEEARIARKAHYDLGLHLRDRLATRAKQYPFTAGQLVTQAGFERRGIRTKAAEAAVSVGSERLAEFVLWRNDLIKLRA